MRDRKTEKEIEKERERKRQTERDRERERERQKEAERERDAHAAWPARCACPSATRAAHRPADTRPSRPPSVARGPGCA